MKIDITVLDNRLSQFINVDSELHTLDSECTFAEGPVWNRDGYYLFSDIPKNAIYKIAGGKKELYLDKSGCAQEESFLSEQVGSNGLAYTKNDELIICQHGNGALAKRTDQGLSQMLVSFMGKRFNSPNDVVASNGAIFFSDPPYGLTNQQLNTQVAQDKARVYCYRNNEINIVSEHYQYPNGVCISPDGSRLYTCSNKPFERFVLQFDTHSLALVRTVANENGDGIKCDRNGNIYLCAQEGIVIINDDGKRLGILKLPAVPANCCFGGTDAKDLFITARENIYLIKKFLC